MTSSRAWLGLLAILPLGLGATAQAQAQAQAQAAPGTRILYGASLVGDLKYPANFTHFDYVNPEAPKGGRIRVQGVPLTSFDSFNPFISQGTPEIWSSYLPYQNLLASSYDQPSTMYGEIAESIEIPDDYSWVIFRLREEARFHDGVPITAADFVFTLDLLREKGLPVYGSYYKNVVSAEALDAHTLKFTFDETGNRELPFIMGQLPALPKHYWEGVDANGEPRDFTRSSLEPPLGSGPYRIARFEAGRYVEYQRVEDFWARDLPVNVGRFNFDQIRVDYYRDDTIALEAFFGDEFDLRLENSSRNWATGYDRPAVRDGAVIRDRLSYIDPNAQSFILNLRREKFADRRVRQALGLAFNFEWLKTNIFYGEYERVRSYFHGSELAATGLPSQAELELLEPYRDQLPPELFTTEYAPPVSDGTETNRNNLFRALQLLQEAGWQLRDGALVDAAGNPFEIEFLLDDSSWERVVQPYIRDLEKLGIQGNIRVVDAAQYVERVQSFNFDVFSRVLSNTLSPGNEQRDYWSTAAADEEGSRNFSGVRNPVVDALIDKIIFAPDRAALVTASRALDRVLLWNYYTIPEWTTTTHRIAYWDRFDRPAVHPEYGPINSLMAGIVELWWSKEAEQ
jgi:microcin C transport system substrate-binding protein